MSRDLAAIRTRFYQDILGFGAGVLDQGSCRIYRADRATQAFLGICEREDAARQAKTVIIFTRGYGGCRSAGIKRITSRGWPLRASSRAANETIPIFIISSCPGSLDGYLLEIQRFTTRRIGTCSQVRDLAGRFHSCGNPIDGSQA